LPRLIPKEVNRTQGQILVSKAEGIDIEPVGKPSGVRPIDPEQDVYSQAKKEGVALAFEFVGDWSLDLLARRYEPAPGKLTSIDRGLLRVVVTANEQSRQPTNPRRLKSFRNWTVNSKTPTTAKKTTNSALPTPLPRLVL
jgi:hypothetical protein